MFFKIGLPARLMRLANKGIQRGVEALALGGFRAHALGVLGSDALNAALGAGALAGRSHVAGGATQHQADQ